MKVTIHQLITDDENGLQCVSSFNEADIASAARSYMQEHGADIPGDATIDYMLDYYCESVLSDVYLNITSEVVEVPFPGRVAEVLSDTRKAIEFAHEQLSEEFRGEGDDDDEINSRDAMLALSGALVPLEEITRSLSPSEVLTTS